MTGATIKGPGILFVNSKIARNNLLDAEVFMKIIETSGVDSAIRYKDVNEKADKHFWLSTLCPILNSLKERSSKRLGCTATFY